MKRLDRRGYEIEVDERFEGNALDRRIWLPYYLPHWSSREAAAARFDIGDGGLRLRIDADQAPWNPEYDGWLRVSSLQTGGYAGPVGSGIGQLRFRKGLVVRQAQPTSALYTPRYGLFEVHLCAIADPVNMVALWMIGIEDEPERSGEICVCEIFGRDMTPDGARVGMGIHPWSDPALIDAFEQVPIQMDARAPHWYAAEWLPERVAFYVDEVQVKVVEQSPAYPMQVMLSLYEFGDGPDPVSPPGSYPKIAEISQFRGWRPISGPGARPSAWPHRRVSTQRSGQIPYAGSL